MDIQPITIELNEVFLKEIMDFFTVDIPSAPTNNTTTELSTPPIALPLPKTSKTKVISEKLELVIRSGSSGSAKTVILTAKQLFFASQPFKAGLIEGML